MNKIVWYMGKSNLYLGFRFFPDPPSCPFEIGQWLKDLQTLVGGATQCMWWVSTGEKVGEKVGFCGNRNRK